MRWSSLVAMVSSGGSPVLSGLLFHVIGDLDLVPLGAGILVVRVWGLHLHQVDQPDEGLVGFGATGTSGKVDDRRRGRRRSLTIATVRKKSAPIRSSC
jgi:hypothetical protein